MVRAKNGVCVLGEELIIVESEAVDVGEEFRRFRVGK